MEKAPLIFLSHSHKDKKVVDAFVNLLMATIVGVDIQDRIFQSSNKGRGSAKQLTLSEGVAKGIGESKIFVLCGSAAAEISDWVKLELREAIRLNKTIYHVGFPFVEIDRFPYAVLETPKERPSVVLAMGGAPSAGARPDMRSKTDILHAPDITQLLREVRENLKATAPSRETADDVDQFVSLAKEAVQLPVSASARTFFFDIIARKGSASMTVAEAWNHCDESTKSQILPLLWELDDRKIIKVRPDRAIISDRERWPLNLHSHILGRRGASSVGAD